MNSSTAENPVQWLFLDLNAFFASCEQQENPALRGRPIIVVQTLTDSAVAIAASYAAKAFGIKTGTLMRDARQLCPDVVPVQANHRLYAATANSLPARGPRSGDNERQRFGYAAR